MASTSSTFTGKNKKPEGWTKADKFYLMEALKNVGSNVKLLKEYLPNKTEAEIEDSVKHYKHTHGSDNIQTETADALCLIAEYAGRPDPVDTGNIDFKKAYLTLAVGLEGKPLPEDKVTEALFAKCMAEVEKTARELLKGQLNLKKLIESLANPATDNCNTFSRPTENNELSVLRDLITNYNSLYIIEANLKFATNPAKFIEEE